MRNAISFFSMVILVVGLAIVTGCDMGTYESRASQPIPEGAMIAGEVPASVGSDTKKTDESP